MVIATATLALQHQLVERDVPRTVASMVDDLPRDIAFATLKGRSNYLKLARTEGVEDPDSRPSTTDMERQAQRVMQWAEGDHDR